MAVQMYSFEKLIHPVSPEEFLEKYWEQRYLLISRKDPGYYGPLLSFSEMDRCIHAARDTAREIFTLVPPPGSGRSPRQLPGTDISPKELYKAYSSGETIVVNSAQRIWPALTAVTGTLSEVLNAVASVNIYLTPADSQGFDVHIDSHDVFVVQVDGSKDWYLYEPYYDAPMEGGDARHYLGQAAISPPADGEKLVQKVRLEKGDFLYMPRGVPHKAATSGEASLHLTVGIHTLYWIDIVKAAVEAAARKHPELRAGLPPGFVGNPEVRAGMEQRFGSLLELASETAAASFGQAIEAMVAHRLAWQSFPPDGHFEQLARLDRLTPDAVVNRRVGMDCRLVEDGDAIRILFAENEIRGPRSIAAALAFVRDHKRFRVTDLPKLDENSKLVLTRRLIREGLLRVEEHVDESVEAVS